MFDFFKGWRRKAACVSLIALLCGGVLLLTLGNSKHSSTRQAAIHPAATPVEPVPSKVDVSTDPNSDYVWVEEQSQNNGMHIKGHWRRKTGHR